MKGSIQIKESQTKEVFHIRDLVIQDDSQKIDENLICPICQELVIDPKECEECQNLFCENCLIDWCKKQNQCPFKCPAPKMKIKEPHKFVRNTLMNLKLNCKNKQQGCNEILILSSLNNHIQEKCQYQTIKCEYPACGIEILRLNIKAHEEQCEFKQQECQKCRTMITRRESKLQEHDCIKSLLLRIDNQSQQIDLLKQSQHEITMRFDEQITKLQNKMSQMELSSRGSQNQCQNNHKLTWSQGFMANCDKCKRDNIVVRYYCLTCKLKYCQICKPPIVVDKICPEGHLLVFQQNPSQNIICDFCETYPKQRNDQNWNDSKCDFDICNTCYKKQQ